MRPLFTLIHRWAGLVIAAFLFFSGVTGAVISWDHELDEVLNPELVFTKNSGAQTAIPSLELTRQLEERHPNIQALIIPMAAEPGHSLAFYVEPRVNPATGKLFDEPYNQVFVDPVTGEELGKREWGAVWPITKETFVSFLYKLHYSLHIPEMWGTDRWGIWFLGVIAMIWTLDCFVGFYLTLPSRRRNNANTVLVAQSDEQDVSEEPELLNSTAIKAASKSWWQRWKPAWKIRWGRGSAKLNFDLHRAFGLWTWALLFIVAFTAFSLNLYREVFFPAMSLVSNVTPSPFDVRTPTKETEPIAVKFSYADVLAVAQAEAKQRGWDEPVGSMFYARNFGIYGATFFKPDDEHGAGGVGHRELYFDGNTGNLLGDRQPWKGTAADIFVQAQFPLHSGRILGLPGRILISVMGLVVAMLSVTGVIIWMRKRTARQKVLAR